MKSILLVWIVKLEYYKYIHNMKNPWVYSTIKEYLVDVVAVIFGF